MSDGPPATRMASAEVERCFRLLVRLVPALWPHGWTLCAIHFETETERFKAHFRWREGSVGGAGYVRLQGSEFVAYEGGGRTLVSVGRALDTFIRVARAIIAEES